MLERVVCRRPTHECPDSLRDVVVVVKVVQRLWTVLVHVERHAALGGLVFYV